MIKKKHPRRRFTDLGLRSPSDEVFFHEQQRFTVAMQLGVTNLQPKYAIALSYYASFTGICHAY